MHRVLAPFTQAQGKRACTCNACVVCEGVKGVCECMYVHMYVVVQCTQGNYAAAALCLRVRQLAVAVLGRGDSDEPD